MLTEDYHFKYVKKIRTLIQLLLFSGSLNIALISTFFYFVWRESQPFVSHSLSISKKQPIEKNFSNGDYLFSYTSLSFKELEMLLSNKQLVEDGYLKRDLALGCLVAQHDFNLEKALYGQFLQKRNVSFTKDEKKIEITLFPGLNDATFDGIVHYCKTEKYPFTTKGLFLRLQKDQEASLKQAFFVTPEFLFLQSLFSQDSSIDPESLLTLILEGPYEAFYDFIHQKSGKYTKEEMARSFLLSKLSQSSKTAASLLLQIDLPYVVKRLDDHRLVNMLNLIDATHPKLREFSLEILKSPRSDNIHQMSAAMLYRLAKKEMPMPFEYKKALALFAPTLEKEKKVVATAPLNLAKRSYVVQEGDNLWKISRKFKVDLRKLVKMNHLENERLYPGRELQIPKN